MNISHKGLGLIQEFEGFIPHAYKCPAGVWTIGYGSTVIDGEKVKPTDKVSRDTALQLLTKDCQKIAHELQKLVKVPLSQTEIDALICFIYNIGIGAFSRSTMLKLINDNQKAKAALQFDRWNKAGGKVLPGLIIRRAKERALFAGGLY